MKKQQTNERLKIQYKNETNRKKRKKKSLHSENKQKTFLKKTDKHTLKKTKNRNSGIRKINLAFSEEKNLLK